MRENTTSFEVGYATIVADMAVNPLIVYQMGCNLLKYKLLMLAKSQWAVKMPNVRWFYGWSSNMV